VLGRSPDEIAGLRGEGRSNYTPQKGEAGRPGIERKRAEDRIKKSGEDRSMK